MRTNTTTPITATYSYWDRKNDVNGNPISHCSVTVDGKTVYAPKRRKDQGYSGVYHSTANQQMVLALDHRYGKGCYSLVEDPESPSHDWNGERYMAYLAYAGDNHAAYTASADWQARLVRVQYQKWLKDLNEAVTAQFVSMAASDVSKGRGEAEQYVSFRLATFEHTFARLSGYYPKLLDQDQDQTTT